MAKILLKEIADKFDATIQGDASLAISKLSSFLDQAPGAIAFIKSKGLESVAKSVRVSNLAAIILSDELKDKGLESSAALIFVSDPLKVMVWLAEQLYPEARPKAGISDKASIDPSAEIARGVHVGAFSVIGANVKIGENTVIHPHVVIYDDVQIGERVVIHSGAAIRERVRIGSDLVIQNGAVIGSDGFGYIPDPTIGLRKVPQVGDVQIGSGVDIGANTCVDRGAFGDSIIGDLSKIDNLVQVGHNARIGKGVIICGQAGLAGSVTIGDAAVLAGRVGIVDHVTLASKVRLGAQAVAWTDIKEAGDYMGNPAVSAGSYKRSLATMRQLSQGKKSKKKGV